MSIVQAFIPVILIVAIVWFVVVKPIRKRMVTTNTNFLNATPTWVFIVGGIVFIGYGIGWNVASDNMALDGVFSREARNEMSALRYGGFAVGALGVPLFVAGLFKGINQK